MLVDYVRVYASSASDLPPVNNTCAYELQHFGDPISSAAPPFARASAAATLAAAALLLL